MDSAPGRTLATVAAACISTHYMALGRAATGNRVPWTPIPPGTAPWACPESSRRRSLAAGGRSHVGPPPSGRLEQVISLRCWYGSRTRDSQIHGLVLYPLS